MAKNIIYQLIATEAQKTRKLVFHSVSSVSPWQQYYLTINSHGSTEDTKLGFSFLEFRGKKYYLPIKSHGSTEATEVGFHSVFPWQTCYLQINSQRRTVDMEVAFNSVFPLQ